MESVSKFLRQGTPPLVSMIQCRTADECIAKIERSLKKGAEAFGIQLCQLERSERTDEKLKAIFDACCGLPIYITSYRYCLSEGMSDKECGDLLLRAVKCGALLCDLTADFFDANEYQLTENKDAVQKQKELIDKIHSLGGEVLMSTHDFRNLSADEVFNIAKTQASRGADVLKIVVRSESFDMLSEYISAISRINREIKKPILFLDIGECSFVLRRCGGFLGSCMYLCVESYNELDTKAQPLLEKMKLLRDTMLEA